MNHAQTQKPSRYGKGFLCVVLLLAGGCSPAGGERAVTRSTEDGTAVTGDTLVISSIGDARTLIPILASDSASGGICGLVYNGLVRYAPDLTLEGELAERWDIADDGLVIVFHLRRNVRWHDGQLFTAADVAFTYQKLVDPSVPTPYSGDFERVQSLEVVDDYTVRIRYKEPFAPAVASWGMQIIPKHLLEGEDLLTTKYARDPVGTGPYRFRRWNTADVIELTANPDYFEHRPYIDRYLYRIIPDQDTAFLELATGQIDQVGLTPLQYHRHTDTPFFQARYTKFRYPSFGYTYMGYNLEDHKFADPRVRQALNYAVNKQEIIQGVLMGLGQVSTGPFPQESWAYNPTVVPAPYDPERARALLAEAGWRDTDGDGWLDKHGKPFTFMLLTNQGNQQRQRTAEIIQRRLKEVGINMEIRVLEWSVFISQFVNTRNFEAILLGWSLSRDPDLFDIFHSSKTKPGEFNLGMYKNTDVDRLIEQGRRTFGEDKRMPMYHRMHELIYADQPYMFLYVPDATPIVHNRFRNVKATAIGIGYNLIDWYVPFTEQRYSHWTLTP